VVLKIPVAIPDDLNSPAGSVIVDPTRRLKHSSATSLLEDVKVFQTIKQLVNLLNDPKRLLALSTVMAEVINTFKYLSLDV